MLLCWRRRQWQPTLVLVPGKSHGQRSLVGCSPWGRWELDTTERLHFTSLYDDLGELKYKEKKWSFEFWSGLKRLKVKVAQLCPTLCHPMDYTVHGVLQARILEWITLPFSRGSSQPRDWTQVSHMQADSLPTEPRGKPNWKIAFLLLWQIGWYRCTHHCKTAKNFGQNGFRKYF